MRVETVRELFNVHARARVLALPRVASLKVAEPQMQQNSFHRVFNNKECTADKNCRVPNVPHTIYEAGVLEFNK